IEVVGRTGHSSRPDLAVSAAEAMVDVVRALRSVELPRSHPALAPANLVLTDMITGPYPGLSNVPDRCIATYDPRTLPGETESDVLEPIRAALVRGLAGHAGASGSVSVAIDTLRTYTGGCVEAPNFAPAWWAGPEHEIVKRALGGLRAAGLAAETTA